MSANEEKKKIINELRAENRKLEEQLKERDGNGPNKKIKKKDKGTYTDLSIGSEGVRTFSGLNLAEIDMVEKYKEKYNDYKGRFIAQNDQIAVLKKRIRELENKDTNK